MSSSNSLLAVAVQNGSIGIVDVLCRRTARIMSDAHKASITALEFSPDGRWLLSADEDGLIKVTFATSLRLGWFRRGSEGSGILSVERAICVEKGPNYRRYLFLYN